MRADNLPSLSTYEEALHRYNNTTPIRGWVTRPLGARRDHKVFRIEKHGEAVVCIMHRTPIVTYYAGGTIKLETGGWDTQTTGSALCRLLGRIGYVYGQHGRLVIRLKSGEYPVDGLIIQVNAEGYWAPTNAEPCVVHRINRAKARAVRQQYAAFLTYAKGVLSLMSDDEGMIDGTGREWGHLSRFPIVALEATDDPDADVERWHSILMRRVHHNRAWIKADYLLADISKSILKAHASEVLDKVVLPLGVLKKDKYAGWV